MFGLKHSRLRRKHVQSLDPADIATNLKEQLDQLPEERGIYARWFQAPVDLPSLPDWIDEDVAGACAPTARRACGPSSTTATTAN